MQGIRCRWENGYDSHVRAVCFTHLNTILVVFFKNTVSLSHFGRLTATCQAVHTKDHEFFRRRHVRFTARLVAIRVVPLVFVAVTVFLENSGLLEDLRLGRRRPSGPRCPKMRSHSKASIPMRACRSRPASTAAHVDKSTTLTSLRHHFFFVTKSPVLDHSLNLVY